MKVIRVREKLKRNEKWQMSSRVLAAFRQPHPLTEPYVRFSRIRLFIAVPSEVQEIFFDIKLSFVTIISLPPDLCQGMIFPWVFAQQRNPLPHLHIKHYTLQYNVLCTLLSHAQSTMRLSDYLCVFDTASPFRLVHVYLHRYVDVLCSCHRFRSDI